MSDEKSEKVATSKDEEEEEQSIDEEDTEDHDSDDDEYEEDEEYEESEPFDHWAYVPGIIVILIGLIQLIWDQSQGNVNDTLLIGGFRVFCGFGTLLLIIGFLIRLKSD